MVVQLAFDCLDGRPEKDAARPTLLFRLRIAEISGAKVHSIELRCQIRIQPRRRRYSAEEAERLRDLLGDRWGETVHPMQLAITSATVPGFTGSTEIDLRVPCSSDPEVTAGRYSGALTHGVIPLLLLFSGTVYYQDGTEDLAAAQVPWQRDTSYQLPVSAWRELIE